MLWLCLYLPRLPLDALGEIPDGPAAVVISVSGRRSVLVCNAAAEACGIRSGAAVAAAQVLNPKLRLLDRSPGAEQQALKGVAAWAYQYTDRLVIEPAMPAVLAELSASLKLFGGVEKLLRRIAADFAPLGYAYRLAVAPTPSASELLALGGETKPVLTSEDLRAQLSPLPLRFLQLPPEVLIQVSSLGLRTLDELLNLPQDQLARRFGPETVDYLRRLAGELPDPRPAYRVPQTYRRRFEMQGSAESSEALIFPLRRLLLELQGALRARDCAVRRLALVLEHEDRAATRLMLELGTPRCDAGQLLALAREKLERSPVAAPVDAIALEVEEFAEAIAGQQDLFDDRLRREESWQQLRERLIARLGSESVRGLVLQADHRPELSFRECGLEQGGPALEFPARPLWLLREPRALTAPPCLISRPERIETGWWDKAAAGRDYYIAETGSGARVWVFQEQDRWFLHGIWS
jgi:protein ImuB